MAYEIQDGKGSGNRAAVTDRNRLEVFSIAEDRVADISKNTSDTFIVASDFITLTDSGSFNGILYIQNDSDNKDLFLQTIRTCSDQAGSLQCRLIKNPTGGTLISSASAADQISTNLGSSKAFDGMAYTAAGSGKTITGGTNLSQFINRSPGHSIQDYRGAIVIPNGQSLGMTVKPSTATTLCVELVTWFE